MRLTSLVSALALIGTPALSCPLYSDAVAAVEAQDAPAAAALYDKIEVDPACGDPIRTWVADYLSRASFRDAMAEGTAPANRRKGLEQALRYQKHWRSYAELGKLAWTEGDYATAAEDLQLALNELAEGDPAHVAKTDEIAQVYKLASDAVALADSAVDLPKTRAGTPGGIFQTSIRGFTVEEVQLPVTFEYDSTTFDAKGETYAMALSDYLKTNGAEKIELNGHTDPRGSEDFNLELSVRRAEALAAFLKDHGYKGTILTKGFGETQPPEAPEGIAEGSEEYYRLARRVAFRTE